MNSNDILERRIVDFDSRKCKIENDQVILLSPLEFIEGDNLYLPEAVKMPDGKIIEEVYMDISYFKRVLSEWKSGYITLYAGKNYVLPYSNYVMGFTSSYIWYLHLPNVNYICLYDDVCEVSVPDSTTVLKFSTQNGILYCDGNVCFVPDHNSFAESAPLETVHNIDVEIGGKKSNLEECVKDLFGGIYSLDGKSFVKWDGHTSVKSYSVRPGVEKICNDAFWVQTGIGNGDHGLPLREIILPDSLKYIGKEAFRATSLNELRLPSEIKEIDDRAFLNCQVLETILLPDGIKRLGKFAFAGSAIKSIFIPKSVEYIGDECFDNCFQLSYIQVDDANRKYSSDEGVLFNADKTSLIRIPPELSPDRPENCNEQGELYPWDNIKSYIRIIHGLTQFENIHEGVTDITIQEDNKQPCVSTRKNYAIPDTVESIRERAFQRSHIKELFIPKNVVSIGRNQFLYCRFSEIIVSRENTHFECLDNALINKDRNTIIHWFGNEENIVVPTGIDIIGEDAFYNNNFKTLVIPEGVKCIEHNAFYCSSPVKISLPSSLCYISEDAFAGIQFVDSYGGLVITVPHGLKEKYKKLFYNNYSIRRFLKELDAEEVVSDQFDETTKKMAIVSENELEKAKIDDEGNNYSKDGKRLLKAESSIVHVQEGTEVICENAISADIVHVPSSVKYIGIDGIFADRLVIEGDNTYIAGLNVNEQNTIYIPCGTWSKYYSQIESNMTQSREAQCGIAEDGYEDFKEKFDEYKMIEISKSNLSMYLQQQKCALVDMINEKNHISEYFIKTINGVSSQRLVLFRTINTNFIFNLDSRKFTTFFGDVLFMLGYSLQDVCNMLGVSISEIEIKEENINNIIGKTLARRLLYSWTEDFVDEDSGDIVSIDRHEVIREYNHTMDKVDIQTLFDLGIKKVVVYENEIYYNYPNLISSFPVSKDELVTKPEVVLDLLFSGKDNCQVTDEERLLMGYNLLTAYKDLNKYYGYVNDGIIPFKIKKEDQHSEITPEEKRVMDLIEEFYDNKINAIKDCKTDMDVMHLFTTDEETKNQLVVYLKENKASVRMVNMFVNQFFDRLLTE